MKKMIFITMVLVFGAGSISAYNLASSDAIPSSQTKFGFYQDEKLTHQEAVEVLNAMEQELDAYARGDIKALMDMIICVTESCKKRNSVIRDYQDWIKEKTEEERRREVKEMNKKMKPLFFKGVEKGLFVKVKVGDWIVYKRKAKGLYDNNVVRLPNGELKHTP
jgi:hypothetical protein